MRILVLSYFFEPDLSAGSFRNTALVKVLDQLPEFSEIHVITTQPNRYHNFQAEVENGSFSHKVKIDRITVPQHKNGLKDQVLSYLTYYRSVNRLVKNKSYDLVYASSSKLFTAFLGRRISYRKRIPLYLDIRDIFVDSIKDLFRGKIYNAPLRLFIRQFEKYTFKKANHINLVSEGFKPYFTKYDQPSYSYFTNGIDDEFLEINTTSIPRDSSTKRIITYAGNIGEGQGLHIFVPDVAKALHDQCEFRIIGSGGAKQKLVDGIEKLGLKNVKFIQPVKRVELIQYYKDSDFLLVHLNDFEAFKKVLPSKIFECASFDKPIIAGIGGYSAQFIKEHVANCLLFEPGNVSAFLSMYRTYDYKVMDRSDFRTKFNRMAIMKILAKSILEVK